MAAGAADLDEQTLDGRLDARGHAEPGYDGTPIILDDFQESLDRSAAMPKLGCMIARSDRVERGRVVRLVAKALVGLAHGFLLL